MYVSYMGELTVWIVFPTIAIYVCIDHRHWFHWTAVWLQLHVSLVHGSACSFAASQASDLTLLVGYVAYEDFNFKWLCDESEVYTFNIKIESKGREAINNEHI